VKAVRVLVVDDLPDNLEMLRELLEPEGYCVETAADGQEAIDKALAAPPDLVLMDVSMPRVDGLEACRRLKTDPRTRLVPVVLVTALGHRENRLRGIAAGADDFLTKPVDIEQLLARARSALHLKALLDQLEEAENVLGSLANAVEAKDSYTRGHSDRVARWAENLAQHAGLDSETCRNVRRAGLIHDIGKIGTPSDYLYKPGPLTQEEMSIVRQHPVIGFTICQPLRTLAPLLPLIRGHHERLNGSGYPDGLRAEAIPTALRCLTVADIFDALTSVRAYRDASPADKALDILAEEARVGLWDANVVALLAELVARDRAAGPS
jgi:putative two-component system response regulator